MKNSLKIINPKDLIIDETNDYIFVNKPALLSTLSDRTQSNNNLYHVLKNYNENILLCHRLDKETSGVIVFAKNKPAQRWLSTQFMRKEVYKVYDCIVHGQHNFSNLSVKGAIAHNSKNKGFISRNKGKKAKTIFSTNQIYRGFTSLKCIPFTGRTHQIRIHSARINAPLISDFKYGGKEIFLSELKKNFRIGKDRKELPIIKRIPLHASKLKFTDRTNKEILIEVEPPKDYLVLLKQLEKFANLKFPTN